MKIYEDHTTLVQIWPVSYSIVLILLEMSLDTRRVDCHYSRTRELDSVLWAVLNLSLDMRVG